jgi:diguanylate cyclase (GGDEF)-like protein/PAS domain S-box-containing protein
MGILILAPAILAWREDLLRYLLDGARASETLALLALAAAIGALASSQSEVSLLYLMIPLLVWAAFRLNVLATAVAGVALCVLALGLALPGAGPASIAVTVGPTQRVELLQVLVALAVVMPNLLAIIWWDRRRATEHLAQERDRTEVTLGSIGDAVITTDVRGVVQFLNPIAEQLTGWRDEDARGRDLSTVFRIVNDRTRAPAENPVTRCLQSGKTGAMAEDAMLISLTGHEYAVEDSAAPIWTRDGVLQGAVLVFRDVSTARRISREMSHQAAHDALTGLVNRREFEARLKRMLQTAAEDDTRHALCYLDLDQFKLVNDTGGHEAGDELLRQLATLFGDQVRTRDTLARLGGDEFGILMERCSLTQARRVAEAVRSALTDFRFHWQGRAFTVGVSIGLVPLTATSGTPARVMRAADVACYAAKEQGRNRIHVYEKDDAHIARMHGDMVWVNKINDALEADRFELFLQPIAAVHGAHPPAQVPDHFELLLRLREENDDVISPLDFLPAAERYGLSVRIDRWVVSHALSWLGQELRLGTPISTACINLSGHSLGDREFLQFVKTAIERTGVPPGVLCFEITETAAISNLSSARVLIRELKSLGCRFALDDFGSGVSSLGYLKTLDVDFLKIDGAFVMDIVDDPVDFAMVRSINEFGQLMGKRTVAEFAMTAEILKRLDWIGVDYAQGMAVGEPRPIPHRVALRAVN